MSSRSDCKCHANISKVSPALQFLQSQGRAAAHTSFPLVRSRQGQHKAPTNPSARKGGGVPKQKSLEVKTQCVIHEIESSA